MATLTAVWASGKGCPLFHAPRSPTSDVAKFSCSIQSPVDPRKRMFIFGLGYTSLHLANCLIDDGWDISGTCRSLNKSIRKHGVQTYPFDTDSGEKLKQQGREDLWQATHLLSSIPPDLDDGDCVLRDHLHDIYHAIEFGKLSWIGYLSSTGVYGDQRGNLVNEDSQLNPVDEKSLARANAEQSWLKLCEANKASVHIFRLGGIYGPGRSILDTITKVLEPSLTQRSRERRRYTARVHVADICQVIRASMNSPHSGVYNVVDDDPSPRSEVIAFAGSLLKQTNMFTIDNSTRKNGSLIDSIAEKRVSNQKIKEELKVNLLYPSYKTGVKSIFESGAFDKKS